MQVTLTFKIPSENMTIAEATDLIREQIANDALDLKGLDELSITTQEERAAA